MHKILRFGTEKRKVEECEGIVEFLKYSNVNLSQKMDKMFLGFFPTIKLEDDFS